MDLVLGLLLDVRLGSTASSGDFVSLLPSVLDTDRRALDGVFGSGLPEKGWLGRSSRRKNLAHRKPPDHERPGARTLAKLRVQSRDLVSIPWGVAQLDQLQFDPGRAGARSGLRFPSDHEV